MADGAPPPEEDFNAIPISDRLSHKNWKARVSAYEALVKTFQTTASDSDPAFKPYINNPDTLKKIAENPKLRMLRRRSVSDVREGLRLRVLVEERGRRYERRLGTSLVVLVGWRKNLSDCALVGGSKGW